MIDKFLKEAFIKKCSRCNYSQLVVYQPPCKAINIYLQNNYSSVWLINPKGDIFVTQGENNA